MELGDGKGKADPAWSLKFPVKSLDPEIPSGRMGMDPIPNRERWERREFPGKRGNGIWEGIPS